MGVIWINFLLTLFPPFAQALSQAKNNSTRTFYLWVVIGWGQCGLLDRLKPITLSVGA